MSYEFQSKKIESQPIVGVRVTTTPDKIGAMFDEVLPEVRAYLDELGVQQSGPPFGRYFDYGEDNVDMQAGLFVPEPVAGRGRVAADELPAGQAAATWHVGPYNTISEAFDALHSWIHDSGHEEAGAPWEVYWTGPADDKDSSKWRTEILWPIK